MGSARAGAAGRGLTLGQLIELSELIRRGSAHYLPTGFQHPYPSDAQLAPLLQSRTPRCYPCQSQSPPSPTHAKGSLPLRSSLSLSSRVNADPLFHLGSLSTAAPLSAILTCLWSCCVASLMIRLEENVRNGKGKGWCKLVGSDLGNGMSRRARWMVLAQERGAGDAASCQDDTIQHDQTARLGKGTQVGSQRRRAVTSKTHTRRR